ncbi:hypothetical protein CHLNCDRAFT_144427 [Chlorella variabilis]|uniref:SGNH hydrolase-type esterase domain-containing protein n=1 Tax=Chlorella variabilis TaxID=554065 RepID=E1ZBF0_CHLVA|nr:hypothetical protein CHLNCDRAFT_144427 [Chlorella variabilis]EFN56843.1 hypothetical protein CHLNCDRAFT_144427 [Chlorella variabilis]|eukprot:XP_005848945.1 hypothetical protein CHLNCDRAFT_144427 [Chlorella variabilis]
MANFAVNNGANGAEGGWKLSSERTSRLGFTVTISLVLIATLAAIAVTELHPAGKSCAECPACPEPQQPEPCPEQQPCPAPDAAAATGSTQATAGTGGGKGGKAPSLPDPLAVLRASPWEPSLPEHELLKGLVSYGDMSRMRRFFTKLLSGQAVTVVSIGGSVSWGHGASVRGQTDLPALVFQWMNATFPHPQHKFLNQAISATPSNYFTLCLQWHVPPDADLVLMEFNPNDGPDKGDMPIRRAHERLIRKLLVHDRRPPLLEVIFCYWALDWMESAEIPYRMGGDDELGVLSQYYHLPFVSDRSLLWDAVYAKGSPNYTAEAPWPYFHHDRNHPNDVGHRYLAEMVILYMRRVLEDLSLRPFSDTDEEASQAPLPPPMLRNNWPNINNSCLVGKLFGEHVVASRGFKWMNDGTKEKPKWGWVGTTPNSTLRFEINTATARAVQSGAMEEGVATHVGVLHLRSYEHMGIVEFRCVAGCDCQPLNIDGLHEGKFSQVYHTAWPVTRAEKCVIEARTLEDTRSGEHKVRIDGVIVSEVAGEHELKDDRIHVDFNAPDGVGQFEW